MNRAVRLDKFLADAGKGTRSEVKNFIRKGLVQINGATVKKPEQKVEENDLVTLKGEAVIPEPEFLYYLLNKPAGCVSATEDRSEKTVMSYVPSGKKGLFPAGRLDKDTEGLLLITNDGRLAHELLSPSKHVEKTYFVRVRGQVTEDDRQRLEKGVDIGDDKPTLPARARILTGENKEEAAERRARPEKLPEVYTELYLTIHEGRFHQVKRMMEAVGKPVVYLKRVSMGPLKLPGDLKKGQCRPLTEEEVRALKAAAIRS